MKANIYFKITALVTGITLASLATTTAYAYETKQREEARREVKVAEVKREENAAVLPVYEVYATDYSLSNSEREEEPKTTIIDITAQMNRNK